MAAVPKVRIATSSPADKISKHRVEAEQNRSALEGYLEDSF
jgi:hypothetical protein